MGDLVAAVAVIGFVISLVVIWFLGYVVAHFWLLILACAIVYIATKRWWNETHY
jgi:hypothetical protein